MRTTHNSQTTQNLRNQHRAFTTYARVRPTIIMGFEGPPYDLTNRIPYLHGIEETEALFKH